MAYSGPIDFATIENTLVSWVSQATGLTVAWASQNRPQMTKPFAVLKMVAGPTATSRDEQRHRTIGAELFTDVVGNRTMTFNLQVFADSDKPDENAQQYLELARVWLSLDQIRDEFQTAKISVSQIGPVSDLDSIAGAGFESRAGFDVVVNTVSALVAEADQSSNWIETVELIDASEG